MRHRAWRWILGLAAMLVAGAIWNSSHTPATSPPPPVARRVARAVRRRLPASAALQATGGPTTAVQVVPDPAAPHTEWAVVPTPAQGAWWFGVNTGRGWTWSAALPSQPLPPAWPLPARELLTRARALQTGQTNAALTVPVAWNSVTGHVGAPICWSWRTVPGTPGVVTGMVVLPATRRPHLVYEITSLWTATNVATGDQALTGIVAVATAHPTRLCTGRA